MEEKTTNLVLDFGGGETAAIPSFQVPVNEPTNPQDMERESINKAMQHSVAVLCLDRSGSMAAEDSSQKLPRIDLVNQGARDFINNTVMTQLDKENTDIEIMAFGSEVSIAKGFAPMSTIEPDFSFTASGSTHLYSTLLVAISDARKRRNELIKAGAETRKPAIFVITDGMPTDDDMKETCNKVLKEYIDKRKMSLIVFCLPGCDPTEMKELCDNVQVIALRNVDAIAQAFALVSHSLAAVSDSDVNSNLAIAVQGLNDLGFIRREGEARTVNFYGGND